MKKKLYLVLVLAPLFAFSQKSIGGEPVFLKEDFSMQVKAEKISSLSRTELPTMNLNTLQSKKSFVEDNKLPSNIYGKKLDYKVDFFDKAIKVELDDKNIFIMEFKSEGAEGLEFFFSDFYMPKGAKLYIYSKEGKEKLGGYNENNNPSNLNKDRRVQFGTEPFLSSEGYIELSVPKGVKESPILKFNHITYIFNRNYISYNVSEVGDCHNDVYKSWPSSSGVSSTKDQKARIKSVGIIFIPEIYNGEEYRAQCSGTLINNTNQDGDPLFLTADHCFRIDNTIPLDTSDYRASEMITMFNYEKKNENDTIDLISNNKNTILGAEMLNQNKIYDYALLRLSTDKETIKSYNVCYAGWDNDPNAYLSMTYTNGVHHPEGADKKHTRFDEPKIINGGNQYSVTWTSGIVEGGSSGSPLFDPHRRVIGTLSTGPDKNLDENGNPYDCDENGQNCKSFDKCKAPNLFNGDYKVTFSRLSTYFQDIRNYLAPGFTSSIKAISSYCPTSSHLITLGPVEVSGDDGDSDGDGNPDEAIDADLTRRNAQTHKVISEFDTWGKTIVRPNTLTQIEDYEPLVNGNLFVDQRNYKSIKTKVDSYYITLSEHALRTYKVDDCNKVTELDPIIINHNVAEDGDFEMEVLGLSDEGKYIIIKHSGKIVIYNLINNKWIKSQTFNGFAAAYNNYDNNEYNNVLYFSNSQGLYSKEFDKKTKKWNEAVKIKTNGYTPLANYYAAKKRDWNAVCYDGLIVYYRGYGEKAAYKIINNEVVKIDEANYFPYMRSIVKTGHNKYEYITAKDAYDDDGNFGLRIVLIQLTIDNNLNPVYQEIKTFKKSFFQNWGGGHFGETKLTNKYLIQRYSSYPAFKDGYAKYRIFVSEKQNNSWSEGEIIDIGEYSALFDADNDHFVMTSKNVDDDLIINTKETEYLNFPLIFNDKQISLGAIYPKKFLVDKYYQKTEGNRLYFSNTPEMVHPSPNISSDKKETPVKTIILGKYTEDKIGENVNLTLYAEHSIVLKPGFRTYSGGEFRAIPVTMPIRRVEYPECSLMFDNIVNPKQSENLFKSYNSNYLKINDTPDYGNIEYYPYISSRILNEEMIDKKSNFDLKEDLQIYPNPITNGEFNVILELKRGSKIRIEIYNLQGVRVLSNETEQYKQGTHKIKVNVNALRSGNYFVKINDGERIITKQIVIK